MPSVQPTGRHRGDRVHGQHSQTMGRELRKRDTYSAGPYRRDRVLEFQHEWPPSDHGSFDHTIKLWDVGTGKCIHTLSGHHGEISSTQFNFSSELCISGSIDRTCKIWNVKTGAVSAKTLRGHNDEILDVAFNATGSKVSRAACWKPHPFCPFLIRVSPRSFFSLFLSLRFEPTACNGVG